MAPNKSKPKCRDREKRRGRANPNRLHDEIGYDSSR